MTPAKKKPAKKKAAKTARRKKATRKKAASKGTAKTAAKKKTARKSTKRTAKPKKKPAKKAKKPAKRSRKVITVSMDSLLRGEAPDQAGKADPSTPTAGELAILGRLRREAARAGQAIEEFIDDLLARREIRPALENTASLVGEIRELFDRLKNDLPGQLISGIMAAIGQAPPAESQTPRPPAGAGIVRKQDAAPREVKSYRSKRSKSKRLKL